MEKRYQSDDIETSESFLETIFNGISEEIMVVDSEGVIHDVNRVFLNERRLSKEAVIGKKCFEIRSISGSHCQLRDSDCPLQKAVNTGERVEVTHRRCSQDESFKTLQRIMYPVTNRRTGEKYFVEISQDVTEYRNLLFRLRSSEKRIRAILDTATDAIISINENHEIVLFNNAAERIFGYKREEVLNQNLNLLIPPKYGNHADFVKNFLKTKEPKFIGKTQTLTACRKNGEEFPIELGLSFQEMDDAYTFTAIIRDITEQKKLEENLLRSGRLAAVGTTVAHVVHEIKSPLMIIGGFSHQIRNSLEDENAIKKLDMILDEVSRLERLVASLGDFTKVYNLVTRPADINSVIQDVLKIFSGIYPPEKYTMKAELASNLTEIQCDPDKLKQVVINIITNGIEAMEESGSISIKTKGCEGGVKIQISDEGIGISDEDILHIFEPFYTTRDRGSGLGLAISYKIVEAHGGELWAESVKGKGTTFFMRLPG
ncbi:PAS domain S-box protein [delta proteobacterium NaphS2]|nr:PAS domain S-box protein [delta proteobacterium NaphS2]